MRQLFIILVLGGMLLAAGCVTRHNMAVRGYNSISQDEAKAMMTDGNVILDVRRPDEFAEGHIPGAICIPNEMIDKTPPPELPDKDAVILVYCRSGRRSKEASKKLADMGYTNIYEFGGINTWTGEIVK